MSINEDCPCARKCELDRGAYFTLIAGDKVHRLCDGDCLVLWCGKNGVGPASTHRLVAEELDREWEKWWETEGPTMADVDPRDR